MNPDPQQIERARCQEIAAQLWCLPQHSHKEMDADFACSIAAALADEAAAEHNHWRDELTKQCPQLAVMSMAGAASICEWVLNHIKTAERQRVWDVVEQHFTTGDPGACFSDGFHVRWCRRRGGRR